MPFCTQKDPRFFVAVLSAKLLRLGFVSCTCFSANGFATRRKEAKHMKHNNLKKPAAVLTALALAAALLAGCGAASDSMAASSAPAESEAVSTETPAESADEGDADEVAAKKCADLIDAI